MKKKILAILPISIGGRLTTNSIIDGYRQNNCEVIVYDELKDKNLSDVLKQDYDQIIGYDFSPLKIKIDNNLDIISNIGLNHLAINDDFTVLDRDISSRTVKSLSVNNNSIEAIILIKIKHMEPPLLTT
jgi:predicted metal-dependent TIM-barrel fold hydrolase